MTKRTAILTTLLLVLGIQQVWGQDKYFVAFGNKNGTPYSLNNPSDYLSQKAIIRREKQGIAIDSTDLPVVEAYVDSVVAKGATVHYRLRWLNGVVATLTSEQLDRIVQLPFVSNATRIFTQSPKSSDFRAEQPAPPTDYCPVGNKADLQYGQSTTQIAMLNGIHLHRRGYTGKGITIGVIDAGFYRVNHHAIFDSLRLSGRLYGTKDFVDPDSDIYLEHSHGMQVLSVMGGYSNDLLIGTAPEAGYWLIRSEDVHSEQLIEEYNWAAAAEFADSVGVDIINTSLGYHTFDVEWQNHSYSELDGNTTVVTQAANQAADKGILVVVSAGNDGIAPWHYISAPADSPKVLTVGAVDSKRVKADFSSFGPTADGRIKPDICAMGVETIVASAFSVTDITASNGTSFSAPVIAGMAACLWQALPQLTAAQIGNLIRESAHQYTSPDNEMGYGIPDFSKAMANVSDGIAIHLVPNPFGNKFTVNTTPALTGTIRITLTDITGRIVHSGHITEPGTSLEVSIPDPLPSGLYIVTLANNHYTLTCKAIKAY